MKVFIENLPYGDIPTAVRRPGELFTLLAGVRVSSDGKAVEVEPVYIPLVRFHRQAGQILIEITDWKKPRLYVTLQARPPFLHVFRFDWGSEKP